MQKQGSTVTTELDSIRTSRRKAMTLATVAFLFAVSGARAQDPAAGAVDSLEGKAAAQTGTVSRELAPKSDVFVGDLVKTGEKSRLAMTLGRDVHIKLAADTSLTIDEFVLDGGSEVSLGGGALLIDKNPKSKARPLTVKSEFGLIAVRGTKFFVGPSKGKFSVFLVRGKLTVTGGGESVTLHKGEGTDIGGPGQKPSPVKAWGKARIDEALALFK